LLVMPLRLTDEVPFRQIVVTLERVGDRLTSLSVMCGGFMRLRERPDDSSLPWPVSKVVEMRDGTERTVASLSGPPGAGSPRARRYLLALMLSPPRSRSIGMRGSRQQWDLECFLCLAAPEELLMGCTREHLSGLLFFGTALPGSSTPMGGVSRTSRREVGLSAGGVWAQRSGTAAC
jgi:hypothetical protein